MPFIGTHACVKASTSVIADLQIRADICHAASGEPASAARTAMQGLTRMSWPWLPIGTYLSLGTPNESSFQIGLGTCRHAGSRACTGQRTCGLRVVELRALAQRAGCARPCACTGRAARRRLRLLLVLLFLLLLLDCAHACMPTPQLRWRSAGACMQVVADARCQTAPSRISQLGSVSLTLLQ